MQVSLLNLTEGKICNNGKWQDLPECEAYQATLAFRRFFVRTCRKGGKRINQFERMTFTNKEPLRVYQRLVCETDNWTVCYTAGQDNQTEMEYIKRKLIEA